MRVSLPTVRAEPLPRLAGIAPADVANQLRDLPGLVLLESARAGRRARWSYLAADPVAVVETASDGPDPFLAARALLARVDPSPLPQVPFAGGLAGFLGYDLGRRLETLPTAASEDQHLPELRLGIHDWVVAWDHRRGEAWLAGRAVDGAAERLDVRLAEVRDRVAGLAGGGGPGWQQARGRPDVALLGAAAGSGASGFGGGSDRLELVSGLDQAAFEGAVETLRVAIADGEIYQANLARRLETPFESDPWPLYRRLRRGDPACFAAFISLGRGPARGGGVRALVSASPEAFLAVAPGGAVTSDPIKGTRSRGLDRDAERELACDLLASAKDRAENIMIVDVVRNDLGRVCAPGIIRVPRLCRLERAAAVQHLVSTVTGRLRPGCDPFDLLSAAFPGASVTGAPKIRAMELIESFEPVRRGPYTGAAGWIGPDGAMATSLLIRTFVADGHRLTLHVGGGITWRSQPAEEWAETQAKARGPLTAIGGIEVTAR